MSTEPEHGWSVLRDEFAARTMQEIVAALVKSDGARNFDTGTLTKDRISVIARKSYEMADVMLRVRAETEGPLRSTMGIPIRPATE